MIFVAPIILKVFLVVLVGSSMDAQRAIRVVLGMIVLGKLVFQEGFRIVLGRAGSDRGGIQANE